MLDNVDRIEPPFSVDYVAGGCKVDVVSRGGDVANGITLPSNLEGEKIQVGAGGNAVGVDDIAGGIALPSDLLGEKMQTPTKLSNEYALAERPADVQDLNDPGDVGGDQAAGSRQQGRGIREQGAGSRQGEKTQLDEGGSAVGVDDIVGGITLPSDILGEKIPTPTKVSNEYALAERPADVQDLTDPGDVGGDQLEPLAKLEKQVEELSRLLEEGPEASASRLEEKIEKIDQQFHSEQRPQEAPSSLEAGLLEEKLPGLTDSQSLPKTEKPRATIEEQYLTDLPEPPPNQSVQDLADYELSRKLEEPAPQQTLENVMTLQPTQMIDNMPNLQPSQLQPDPEPPNEAGVLCDQLRFDGAVQIVTGDVDRKDAQTYPVWGIADMLNVRAAGPNGHRWIKKVDVVCQTDFSLNPRKEQITRPRSSPASYNRKAKRAPGGEPLQRTVVRSRPVSAAASTITRKGNSSGNSGQRQTHDKRKKTQRPKSAMTLKVGPAQSMHTQKFFNKAGESLHMKHQHVHHHAHFLVETPPAPGEHVVFPLRPRKDQPLSAPGVTMVH